LVKYDRDRIKRYARPMPEVKVKHNRGGKEERGMEGI